MKKFYVSLLFFLLGASNLFAAERDEIIDGITYTLNSVTNNAIVISTPGGSVSIPATVQYNSRTYTVVSVQNVGAATSVDIAEGIESIGTAFKEHRNLTSVSIPSTVSRIEDWAFKNCTALTSVVLSDGLSYIGKEAFKGCSELLEITIPTTITSMGDNAFGGCNKLGKITWNAKHCADFTSRDAAPFVTIPESSTDFHRSYNNYTASIEFGEEVEYIPAYLCCAFMSISTVTIPNSVKEIGYWAFFGYYKNTAGNLVFASRLQSIKFGTGLEKIGGGAFVGRTGLTSISIPDNCTEISDGAFSNCDNLQTVTLGRNISIIGDHAFMSDQNLKNINIYALTPPVITSGVFSNYGDYLQAITLNVRPSAIDAYMAADVWKEMFVEAMESDIRTYTLSVSSEDENKGLAFQSGVYDEDTEVVIYVATMPGYQFSQWSDGNTDNPRTVKMVGDITLIAQFEAATPVVKYNLSATANPLEGVAVGSGVFESGSQATLAAIANAGYHFSQWNDGNTSNPRHVTVTANSSYVAQFEKDVVIQKYTLTVSSTNAAQGTAYGQGTYEAGTQIAIFAVANEGYHFTHWHDGNTENPRIVKVTGDLTYTAYFVPATPKYTLAVSASNPLEGTAVGGGGFESGAQATLAAVANAGYHFSQWNDGNTSNPRQVTVTANSSYVAQFEKDVVIQKYTLTVSSKNAVQGTAYGQGTYEAGTQIAIFAVANEGYHFTQWHDGNTENPRMITLTADAMYFANFSQDSATPTLYDLNIAPENATQGWTTEGCAYEFGTQVMIYAHPAEGYQFDHWSDGNKDNPRFITITAEVNLTAKFAVKTITGVSAANSTDTQTQKIVRDGQVYILRGDKLYTMQGQEVR